MKKIRILVLILQDSNVILMVEEFLKQTKSFSHST